MSLTVPQGYRLASVYCGLKSDRSCEDLALVVSDSPAVAAGVYTENVVRAAAVELDSRRTPSTNVRAVVVNSGNANACTGLQGRKDAEQMTELAASACKTVADQVLVMSTGIIGEYLPMDRVSAGIHAAAAGLGNSQQHLEGVARSMMTTDTVSKLAGRTVVTSAGNIHIVGLAKGSGMIGPQMATMLSLIITDAMLDRQTAQDLLSAVTADTFNCISVDGHMSTNDTVLLLANGASCSDPLQGQDVNLFRDALENVCVELARSIAADGEGATHLISIEACGCASRDDAFRIAKTIANSPLVKTAVTGADPNWGRIISAAGYADVCFDPDRLELSINGLPLFRAGAPLAFDASALSSSIRDNFETKIVLDFKAGSDHARFWTCNLTREYVTINAEYHT